MALTPGTRIGSYEVAAQIGAAAPFDAHVRVVLNWFEELKARVPIE